MEKKKDAKKTRLYVRVSEDEKNQILRKMRMAGMVNISEYARRMLLRGRVLLFDMMELKEVSALLSKVGKKLDVYTDAVYDSGSVYIEDVTELRLEQAAIYDLFEKLLVRLSEAR